MSFLKPRKMKKFNIKDIVLLVLWVIAILIITFGAGRNDKIETVIDLNEAFADSIRKEYNSKSKEWEFSRKQYEASEKILKEFLRKKDAELYELSKKKEVRDATKINTVIKFDTIVNTIVKDSIHYATITDKWMKAYIVSRPDSTSLDQQVKMPLTINKGFDGRITVTTPVPYVDIIELKGFTKVEPDRKRNWKYWVGGIIGGALVYGISR